MKIAFVSFDFGEYCIRLVSGIAQDASADVLCFLPQDEAEPYLHLLSDAVKLSLFRKPRIREPLKQLRMVFSLVKQIRAFNPDVIHLQLGHFWFNLIALPFLRRFPLVLTVHDPAIHVGDAATGKTPQWVYDRACFRARERIVHAPQMKTLLLERLQLPAESVHVTPYVVVGDVDPRAGQDIPEEPIVLFFGRIWPYKGLEYLIRAEPMISDQIPEARIVIAGKGEDFQRYRRMMVHPEKFEVYNEYVTEEQRDTLFRRASVIVLPYVEASQSHVISLAYRFQKPVVATEVGGLPEMVDDGETGFLIPPRDVEKLAGAIVCLMQNTELRRRFGRKGLHKVNVECAPEIVGRMTCAVYRTALGSSRLPEPAIETAPHSESHS